MGCGTALAPFWAGAEILTLGAPCTSGFSMYATGAPSRFTLTAAHCTYFADGVEVTNGGGLRMGVSDFIHELYDHQDPAYDLGVVRLDAHWENAPYIYLGEVGADGRIIVGGYASGGIPANGNYCVNGMLSRNCNLVSDGTIRECTGWPPEGRCVYTIGFHALNPSVTVTCRGDSGGPVYYWASTGKVIAAGVVSWGNHEVGFCSFTGGISVVATAVHSIPGLRVLTG